MGASGGRGGGIAPAGATPIGGAGGMGGGVPVAGWPPVITFMTVFAFPLTRPPFARFGRSARCLDFSPSGTISLTICVSACGPAFRRCDRTAAGVTLRNVADAGVFLGGLTVSCVGVRHL